MGKTGICTALTARGEKCQAPALRGNELCYNHAPELAKARARNGAKGGKARTQDGSEVARVEAVRKQLKKVTEEVLAGGISEDVGRVAIQGLNAQLRSAKLRWEAREVEEFAELVQWAKAEKKKKEQSRTQRRGA